MSIIVKSNTELDKEDAKALEAKERAMMPMLTELAAYIKKAFEDAEQNRQTSGVTDSLLKSRRLKSGEYEPDKLQEIRSTGGSDIFFNITAPKCEAFEAWLSDVFSGSTAERSWDIDPTPIPALPADETKTLETDIVAFFQRMKVERGVEPDPEQVKEFTTKLYEEKLQEKMKEATKRCGRMAEKMADMMAEGEYEDALNDFFGDLSDYKSAIMKGPVFQNKKRLKWENGKVKVVQEAVPTWYCVDPMNFYPGPNARTVDDSYICEKIVFDRGELANMRGVEGWSRNKLEEVLRLHPHGNSGGLSNLPGESEMAQLEDRHGSVSEGGTADATIDALEFWGKIEGRMLKQWGMKDGIDDDHRYYEVQCVMVGDIVVRAVLNPDPMDRRPYYVTSFIENKNSLWGLDSLPEKMADCQDGVNTCQRNLLDNLAFAAGPMASVDINALDPSHVEAANELYPRKVFPYDGQKSPSARQPVHFFQPDSNAEVLIKTSEFYKNESDDRTLIPRYITGDNDTRGAAATASGLSMLMNASSRGIKRVIRNVDRRVQKPVLERLYTYLMIHDDDESIKGDAQIVAKGALSMLVREQTQLRRQEFLNTTNNPTDMAIIREQGRAAVLRKVAAGLDMDASDVVPSEEEMRQRAEQQVAQEQALAAAGVSPNQGVIE